MDLRLSEEQELIRSSAREMLAAECPMEHVREMERDPRGYSPELWGKMAELGWMGIALPEEHGGLGYGFLDLCLLLEEMGRARLPSPFVPTVVLTAMPILRFGSDEQRSEYLAAIAGGRRVLSTAAFEPEGGWEVGVATVATPDGDELVLTGTKLYVPYAGAADELLVLARQGDGEEGALTALLVETSAEGVAHEPLETVGRDHLERVAFDGVRVARDRVLGEPGMGSDIAAAIALWGAAARCAEMVGGAQRVLETTVDYAKERHQFGRPIGSFQAVQHHCANMSIDVLGSRFLTYEAAWSLDEAPEAAPEVVSMAKAWTGAAYRRVCQLGHQIHGAIGYTEEEDLHLYLRHAIASDLAFGDTDHHRERVARQLGL